MRTIVILRFLLISGFLNLVGSNAAADPLVLEAGIPTAIIFIAER